MIYLIIFLSLTVGFCLGFTLFAIFTISQAREDGEKVYRGGQKDYENLIRATLSSQNLVLQIHQIIEKVDEKGKGKEEGSLHFTFYRKVPLAGTRGLYEK
jgi:hypothetical protein